MKTIAAWRRRAFFYPCPVFVYPAADFVFIALKGAARGFLRTPSQIVQHAPDVVDVVLHAEALLDQLRHARTGPQIGAKAGRHWPLQQQPLQFALVLGGELRRPATRRARAHTLLTRTACRRLPSAHAAPIHADTLGNLRRQQPFLQ
jgi:hypothetical protein